jgi:hypothetical protein
VTNLVKERAVVASGRLERILKRELDTILGRGVEGTGTSEGQGARGLARQGISRLNRGEVTTLGRRASPLFSGYAAILCRPNSIKAGDEVSLFLSVLADSLGLLNEANRNGLAGGKSAAKFLYLPSGEEVVITSKESEDEEVEAAIRAKGLAVARLGGKPRLAPRSNALFERLDKAGR